MVHLQEKQAIESNSLHGNRLAEFLLREERDSKFSKLNDNNLSI